MRNVYIYQRSSRLVPQFSLWHIHVVFPTFYNLLLKIGWRFKANMHCTKPTSAQTHHSLWPPPFSLVCTLHAVHHKYLC